MARSKGWHPEDIKVALRKRFGPITTLSRGWGMAQNAITNTLSRVDYSRPTELRIAEALGVPAHEIWPHRWNPDGTPLPRNFERQLIAGTRISERQKRKAA
jgi:Ner family transcriptional regulator